MKSFKRWAAPLTAACLAAGGLSACGQNTVSTEQVQEQTQEENKTDSYLDFAADKGNALKAVKGSREFTVNDKGLVVPAMEGDDFILLNEETADLHNVEVEFQFDPETDNQDSMYGVVLRYDKDGSWTFIGQDGHSAKDPDLTTWVMCTSDGKKEKLWTDGQRIYAGRKVPYTVKVRLVDNAVNLYLDNALVFSGEVNGVTQGSGKAGLRYVNEAGAAVKYLSVSRAEGAAAAETAAAEKTIASEDMTVRLDEAFPRVIGYELKKEGCKVSGQETPVSVVEINNKAYSPAVTSEFSEDKAVYHLKVDEIGASFTMTCLAAGNVLRMEISDVQEGSVPVKTINFPGQFLVSMRSDAPSGELRVNNYRKEEVLKLKDLTTERTFQTTSLAVLSSEEAAASINNGSINNRQEIAYQTVQEDGTYLTGLWTNEYQVKGLDEKPIDSLWTEVAITGDRNGDKLVDYQDGAIARRDDIGTKRQGTEVCQNSMSMIAMDVGSAAQYPFLRILDNIKKFDAGTDGFGQMILIKGYQSEGHDSSHPDFANISEKAGGIDDFKVLLTEAEKYNAKVGVHINHTEAYPEAKQYSGDLVSKTLGWTWYDDSYHLIRENDILNQESGAEQRIQDLYDLTDGKLSMIYVDTYQDSRWQMDRIASKITDLGMLLGTEYSEEMIKDSVWSHTLNSKSLEYDTVGNLVRFVDNQTKDIFPESPLFRGLTNRNTNAGFDGWQECKSYDETMKNFYTKVLPQRYLANFPVQIWESADKVVLGEEGQVVTSLKDGVNQITKDERLIADGNKIFIPWDPAVETKIYHWNSEGGSSEWELPKSWDQETSVTLFTLSDQGRTGKKVLPVADHKVTIEAEGDTAYVLYKGSAQTEETDMAAYNWGQGSPVKDMGFDSHTFGYAWEKKSSSGPVDHITYRNNAGEDAGETDKADNQMGNTHIHVEGERDASLSQTMEGLKPGQHYSASVFAEAAPGRAVSITVETPDGAVVTNQATDYSVSYGVPHNDRFGTSYQRTKLTFLQPEGETTAKITLAAASGDSKDSWANFDNVRVTPVEVSDNKGHLYYEDFEHVDQEFGPFVCPTKVTQSHLSESNGAWTRDVIEGRYSLKVRGNGNVDQRFNYMRTVPHRIQLKPNTTYTLGLDYMITEAEANKEADANTTIFTIGVKSDKAMAAGDEAGAVVAAYPCKASDHEAHSIEPVTFTTGSYDDYYIDLLDETYGYEFVIDNFYVDEK